MSTPLSELVTFQVAVEAGYKPRCKHCLYCDTRSLQFTPAPESIKTGATEEERKLYENATRGQRGLVEAENTTPGGCCRFNAPHSANGWPSLVDVTKTYCGCGTFRRTMMAKDKSREKEEPADQ